MLRTRELIGCIEFMSDTESVWMVKDEEMGDIHCKEKRITYTSDVWTLNSGGKGKLYVG